MPIEYTVLLRTQPVKEGHQSGITQPRCRAIRNQKDWQKIWIEHCAYALWTATPIPPAVDFTRAMVIGIWHGISTNGGPKVVIEHVEERMNSILVTYKVTGKPQFDEADLCRIGAGATVYTQPFHIVSVKRSSKRVLFKEVD